MKRIFTIIVISTLLCSNAFATRIDLATDFKNILDKPLWRRYHGARQYLLSNYYEGLPVNDLVAAIEAKNQKGARKILKKMGKNRTLYELAPNEIEGKKLKRAEELKFLERVQVVAVAIGPLEVNDRAFYLILQKSDGELLLHPIRMRLKYDCSEISERIENSYYSYDIKKEHPDWPEITWRAMENNKLYVGMPERAVTLMKGWPTDTNVSEGAHGKHAQLVYEKKYGKREYVYIENGKVSSWSY